MSDFFTGQVLRGTRVAPSNAITTAEPETGVSRHHQSFGASGPPIVEINADQYRSIISDSDPTIEYLIWAANTASITTVEDPNWATEDASVQIPAGTVTVLDTNVLSGIQTDGSSNLIIQDNGNRNIVEIQTLTFIRGDDSLKTEHQFSSANFTFNTTSNILTLQDTATTRTATTPDTGQPPAISVARGDQIKSVTYILSSARFWWARNDVYQTRFGWDGAIQSWRPFRGGPTKNLGKLLPGTSYTLAPRPSNLVLDDYLPGSTEFDDYSMIRLGSQPNVNSQPVAENPVGDFTGILIVADVSVSPEYPFEITTPPLAGVVGLTNGQIEWNPAFVESFIGTNIWYSQRTFEKNSTGVVGNLLGSDQNSSLYLPHPRTNREAYPSNWQQNTSICSDR